MAEFNAKVAPLLDAFDAAVRQYDAACCSGTNYDVEANAVRAYEAANTTFTDGVESLTPPPAAAVAVKTWIASIHADLDNSERMLAAVQAHDPAATRAANRAAASSPAASASSNLAAVLVALGDHNGDGGLWGGQVTQHGPGATTQSYDVTMTVGGTGATDGTTSYSSLHCNGQLQQTGANGLLHVYRERITSGPNRCGGGGTIDATVLGNSMAWRWIAPGITVVGELTRDTQKPAG